MRSSRLWAACSRCRSIWWRCCSPTGTGGRAARAAGFFQYASLGPTFGVVQNVVAERRRATATALLYICLMLFALGGGPLFTGWIIDRFARPTITRFAGNPAQMRAETSFADRCPGGGSAAAGAKPDRAPCDAGARDAAGVLATLFLFGWASCTTFLRDRLAGSCEIASTGRRRLTGTQD